MNEVRKLMNEVRDLTNKIRNLTNEALAHTNEVRQPSNGFGTGTCAQERTFSVHRSAHHSYGFAP